MTNETLETLIPIYVRDKAQLDKMKKDCEKTNTAIKKRMTELHEVEHEAGGYTVKLSTSKRESLNEDLLLNAVKKHKIPGVIKTKEYVDMDALENFLYKATLSPDAISDLNSCRHTTEIVKLLISKKKE